MEVDFIWPCVLLSGANMTNPVGHPAKTLPQPSELNQPDRPARTVVHIPDHLHHAVQAGLRLARLAQLCPGDFAAVRRQTDTLAVEFTAEEFLNQIEAEHRIKPEVREARGMGFIQ